MASFEFELMKDSSSFLCILHHEVFFLLLRRPVGQFCHSNHPNIEIYSLGGFPVMVSLSLFYFSRSSKTNPQASDLKQDWSEI